jgi:hypothetical protein
LEVANFENGGCDISGLLPNGRGQHDLKGRQEIFRNQLIEGLLHEGGIMRGQK